MKKHALDSVSFGFGLFFVTLVSVWMVTRLVDLDLPSAAWFLAGGLILFGGLGVFVTLYTYANRGRVQPSPGQLDPQAKI